MRPSNARRLPVEELILYALLIAVGAIPLTSAVEAGGTIGVEATIGILMIALGLLGVLAFVWRWRRDAAPRDGAQSDPGDGSRSR